VQFTFYFFKFFYYSFFQREFYGRGNEGGWWVGIIPITKELLVSPSSRSEFRAKKPKKKKKKKKEKKRKTKS
jgi:hypothetical protein